MGLEPQRHYPNGDWYVRTPRLRRWIQQLIPKVRNKYPGKIIIQENVYTHPDVDFSGADYIGLHLHANIEEIGDERFIPGRTLGRYRENLRKHLEAAQEAAERDNCRLMVSEASFGAIPTNGYVSPSNTVVSEQQQKELCEAFFDEAWGKTDGIFTWEWGSEPEFHRTLQVTDRPAEDVVRRYYQSC